MNQKTVVIDPRRLLDWPSFHAEFAARFAFPASYDATMDAWVECMTELDFRPVGAASGWAPFDTLVVIQVEESNILQAGNPEIYRELMESCAYVNSRRMHVGNTAYLALAFS